MDRINQDEKTLNDYLGALRRRKVQWLSVIVLILVISAGVAFGLPAVYRATGTILIEQQEIPTELVRSTVTSYADQRIQVINQRVMTSTNLLEVVQKYNLYIDERKKDPIEVVLEEMREDIVMEMISADIVDPRTGKPAQATIAFSVSYDSKSPVLAQKVANEIVSLYLNENLRNRTQMAEETSSFLGDESERLKSKIEEFERKLADFKERNVERLPELSQLNLQLMDRTEREMVEVERQIQALKERRIYLESELAQLHPMDKIISETGERILSPADRLKVLKTQYISASAVYAPSHPDVVKLSKEIKALEAETGGSPDLGEMTQRLEGVRADLATAEQKYSPTHPDVKKLRRAVVALEEELQEAAQRPPDTAPPPKPDNPAYIQIQAQLDAADTELRSHQNKHQRLQSKLESFEERLTQTPQVEREYRALTRDYENALAKYREIKAKEMEARLAEALEAGSKGERFTLIEAPLMPEKPVKPNRLAIMFLGVVFSVAGGLGSAAVAESLDSSVRGARSVSALLGAPPLGVIPYIENIADRRHRLSKRILIMVVLLGLAVITLALFHWLVLPLDVAWYVALRKLEPFLGGG